MVSSQKGYWFHGNNKNIYVETVLNYNQTELSANCVHKTLAADKGR